MTIRKTKVIGFLFLTTFLVQSVFGQITQSSVRTHLEFLASDAMQGRGSGTEFEKLAGMYLGAMMQQFGVEPAALKGGYLQTVEIARTVVTGTSLNIASTNSSVSLEAGKDFVPLRISSFFRGPIKKLGANEIPKSGDVVFINWKNTDDQQGAMQRLQSLSKYGVAGIIVEETEQWKASWAALSARRQSFTTIEGVKNEGLNIVVVNKSVAERLTSLPIGASADFNGTTGEAQKQFTWNAVGKLTGSDPRMKDEAILLSAHMDHLGVRQSVPGIDKIFNGADDDASGCVAVLELAKVLAAGKKPKRTVYFAFFGSEEAGGFGSQHFVATLPFPKDKLIANLQFEMLGRPDSKVGADELWLTGYERSNLGAELARRGAKLVADPHPDQNFFQRSDNYTLARQGIVAHTVSSFGLHKDYHQASDEFGTIDLNHMTRSIESMVVPVRWLANSTFRPEWVPGKKP